MEDATSGTGSGQPTAVHAELHHTSGSAAGKYRRLTVGERGFTYLLYYEVVTGLLSGFPGALGYLLRKIFYRPLLGRMGRGVIIGRHVTFRHPHKVYLGNRTALGDLVSLDAMGGEESGIRLDEEVLIGRNTVLSAKGGAIRIGEGSNIGMNCLVIARDTQVTIGSGTLLAAYCYLMGGGVHGFDRTDVPIMEQHLPSRGVSVGSDCWLGAGVKVADGVEVGDGSVIGAGAVVNASIPQRSVAYGVPARVTRIRGAAAQESEGQ